MNGILATISRELRAYFFSPLAYVILTLFLIGNGLIFGLIVSYLSDPRSSGSTTPLKLFFGDTFFFWMVLLLVPPILSMRLISEERRSGTLESLMTTPVTEAQVVTGKFLAALAFFLFLWVPTLAYVAIIAQSEAVDWGPIAGGYLGILGMGSLFLAVGIFASTFTKNQVVAAIFSFTLVLALFSASFLESLVSGGLVKDALGYVNLLQHMDELSKGIVDSRRLIYYLSATALFLFLTTRALEDRKWR